MSQITTWDEFPTVEYVKGVLRQTVSGEKVMVTRIVYQGGVVIPEHSHEAEQIMLVVSGRLWAKVARRGEGGRAGLDPDHPVQLGPRLPPAGRRGRRVLRGFAPIRLEYLVGLQGPGSVARDDAHARSTRPTSRTGRSRPPMARRSRSATRPRPTPLGPRRPGRGHAAAGPGRGPDRDRPARSRPGRAAASTTSRAGLRALLRAADGGGHGVRRQRGRAAGRGPHPRRAAWTSPSSAGCRTTASAGPSATGSTSPSAGSGCGPRWACRTAATRRPRSCGRATSTGTRSSAGEGARWFHTGGIFAGAVGHDAARSRARRWRPPAATGRSSRYDLNYRPSLWAGIGGAGAGAGGQPRPRRARGRAARATRRTSRPRSGSRSRGWTPALSALDPANFGRMIDRVVGGVPEPARRGDDAARRDDGDPQRLGRGLLGRRRRCTRRRAATGPRDPRPRRRRGLLRLGAGLRVPRGPRAAGGRGVRGGPRGPRDDDAGRHVDGHPAPRSSRSCAAAAPASAAEAGSRAAPIAQTAGPGRRQGLVTSAGGEGFGRRPWAGRATPPRSRRARARSPRCRWGPATRPGSARRR